MFTLPSSGAIAVYIGMCMEQILTKRRYFDIGLQIEELLYSGVFKAGERLPAERELSERFQTSRTTIREEIIMLELKGVVEVKQGAGTYFIDSLEKINQKALLPYSDIGPFELLQARQVIESNITGFAATQIRFNELKQLKRIIEQQEKQIGGDSDKFEELDRQFHNIIAESTQNRVLMKQSAELWRAVRTENPRWKQLNYKYLHKKELRMKWVEDHRSIFLALQKRDAEQARQASWTHLENSKNELVKIFQQDDSLEDFDDFFFAT
ncbi:FadR family transcriptional regulator [Salmonella enterica subsp. enterica serovar Kentucky]|nr:FadR family transcriptional regulator [Salmonella enterica subsp. enterica serovar Kentucky]EJX1005440.1 FadR family transcriptional regulator [Salmonella enterica subsp. enterica serovar Kentucky]